MLSYSLNNINVANIVESSKLDLYQYRVYIGKHNILTDVRNSYWYIDNNVVISSPGTGTYINSDVVCTEIFGYTPETRTSTYDRFTDLPYINGCSSKQLINPNRLGDPTWQLLLLPPYTSEQKHHIHSTSRVVYVAEGSGKSIIGQVGNTVEVDLVPGTVIILDKMVAHHFITTDQHLLVLPLHIFSSTISEKNHPMFNGTYEI
jgi:hypothetical protein